MRVKRILFVLYHSLISIFRIAPFIFKKAQSGNAKVIIRFDDYGVWCNSDWIIIEEEILKLHEKYGVKISFGVIPCSKYPLIAHPLSPSVYPKEYENYEYNPYPLIKGSRRVEILKKSVKKGIAEVAMHGYTHPKGYSNVLNTEFYGMPYDFQYYKIERGKQKLEDLFMCKVCTFIPPHNTYDFLTLNLLHDFKFKCISGSYVGASYYPRCNHLNLNYLWFKYDELSVMNDALFNKPHFKYEPTHIIMLHHTNFTKEGRIDYKLLQDYETFLKRLTENGVSNYSFSNIPEEEVRVFNTAYYLEKDSLLMRFLRKHWPSLASNYIGYNVNK